jgi:hypothetical protein
MAKLTEKERNQRRKKIQDEALESVAARGQFNFRLEGSDIKRLYELAGKRKIPVSAMVREWVLDRLQTEETNKLPAPLWAKEIVQRLSHTETFAALSLLRSTYAGGDKAVSRKLRDYVRQHCNIETDEELRELFGA